MFKIDSFYVCNLTKLYNLPKFNILSLGSDFPYSFTRYS
jgi:hypothetical protein